MNNYISHTLLKKILITKYTPEVQEEPDGFNLVNCLEATFASVLLHLAVHLLVDGVFFIH